MTRIKLELITGIDIMLFVEKFIPTVYCVSTKASNKYMKYYN